MHFAHYKAGEINGKCLIIVKDGTKQLIDYVDGKKHGKQKVTWLDGEERDYEYRLG
jgi:hypothetical protein